MGDAVTQAIMDAVTEISNTAYKVLAGYSITFLFVEHIGLDHFECLMDECTHILPCEDPGKAQFEDLSTGQAVEELTP